MLWFSVLKRMTPATAKVRGERLQLRLHRCRFCCFRRISPLRADVAVRMAAVRMKTFQDWPIAPRRPAMIREPWM